MAEFRRWKVDFDQNSSGLVDRRPVADPPGYMSSLKGVVREPSRAEPSRAKPSCLLRSSQS